MIISDNIIRIFFNTETQSQRLATFFVHLSVLVDKQVFAKLKFQGEFVHLFFYNKKKKQILKPRG